MVPCGAALVQMLAVARDLKVDHGDLTAMDTQRYNLLELLIRLFAERLLAAVRRGLPRRYVLHEEDLAVLRGTLNVKRQFTSLAVRPDLVASRFDELSEDTPLNRMCKAAVTRLAGVTCLLENHRHLMELLARLDNVANSASPLQEPVMLDRTNTAFHDVYRLAQLFLRGDWQDATSGRASGFALLVPHERPVRGVRGQIAPEGLGGGPRAVAGPEPESPEPAKRRASL